MRIRIRPKVEVLYFNERTGQCFLLTQRLRYRIIEMVDYQRWIMECHLITYHYTSGQRNVVCNKMWWVQCPNQCQSHPQYQLLQDDISRLSISNSTKIFKGAEYNLSIHVYKFCSHRSLSCIPALGRRRTPFKLGLVQRSTTSGRRSWETSK